MSEVPAYFRWVVFFMSVTRSKKRMSFSRLLNFSPLLAFAVIFSLGMPEAGLAQPEATETVAPDDVGLVARFDNWEVRHTPGSKTYYLIGIPADKSGQLWLMCEDKNLLTVAVSMRGRGAHQNNQKSQIVTLKIDDGAPRAFSFLIFESFVAMATEMPGTTDGRV